MTDLHALLKKSIVDKGISDPQDRYEIYIEARKAVIRRLTDREPPLRADVIGDRVAAFDNAVADIEEELREHFMQRPGLPAPDAIYDDGSEQTTLEAHPVRARYYDEPEPAAPVNDPAANGAFVEDPLAPYADDGVAVYQDDAVSYVDDAAAEPAYDGSYRGGDRDVVVYNEVDYEDGTAGEGYDAPLGYDPDEAGEPAIYDEDAPYETPLPDDRWSKPQTGSETGVGPLEAKAVPRPRQPRLAERTKIGLLLGAILALVVALGTFAALYFVSEPAEDGITVAIDDRRQVSDSATALRVAAEDLAVRQTFVIFEGFDPTVFESANSNPVRFDNDGSGSYARIATSTGAAGARLRIGPGLASQLAGEQIRVRIITRSSRERGAASMRFAYQSGVAISHWQTANLEPNYTEVGIRWRVPAQRTSASGDYLIIEPGIPGDGSGADIRAVEIDVLAP